MSQHFGRFSLQVCAEIATYELPGKIKAPPLYLVRPISYKRGIFRQSGYISVIFCHRFCNISIYDARVGDDRLRRFSIVDDRILAFALTFLVILTTVSHTTVRACDLSDITYIIMLN